MTTIIARSAESVHWYGQDGSPQYTVKAKDGSDRPTTLRDARKMDLVPSVTTVMKVAAKPALEAWKMEQMLLAALTLPRSPTEDEKSFIARVVADSKETGKRAADRGTQIHESIEKYFLGHSDIKHTDIATAFDESTRKHFGLRGTDPWVVEASFSSPMGFGGKVDLYSGIGKDAPTGIVVDAKTKEFAPGDSVVAYDEHLMQLAAYRNGLNMPEARCANAFVSVTHPGVIHIHEWSEEDLQRGWKMFQALLEYWKLKNKFEGKNHG